MYIYMIYAALQPVVLNTKYLVFVSFIGTYCTILTFYETLPLSYVVGYVRQSVLVKLN